MRSPSTLSDVRVNPSFLSATAAKKLRTECCCHPVVFMIAAIVVPLGFLSRARTVSCLVLRRVEAEPAFSSLAVLFGRFAGVTFAFPGVLLLCDILRSFRLRRHTRRHHRSPTLAVSPAGRDPRSKD